jgi:hypothetical protein
MLVQAKPGRPTALIITVQFLSRAGSPTQQKIPLCPLMSDSTMPKKLFGTLVMRRRGQVVSDPIVHARRVTNTFYPGK